MKSEAGPCYFKFMLEFSANTGRMFHALKTSWNFVWSFFWWEIH